VSARVRKRGMSRAGRRPMAKRMNATCEPVSRADASLAVNAIAPNSIEELTLDRDILTRGVSALFDNPSLGRYYVVESHDESSARVIASLMITYEWSDWRNGMVWWIQSVYTVPEFRRRGIYATLYDHIRAQVADDPRIRGIRLYVDNRNVDAQKV